MTPNANDNYFNSGEAVHCTCSMDGFTTANSNHDDACRLWWEIPFCMGEDVWDAEIQRLVPRSGEARSTSPWVNADEYIWDGDTPVIRTDTAMSRLISTQPDDVEVIEVGVLEAEAVAAVSATNEVDATGMLELTDGSWADFEQRVTYRRQSVDGAVTWVDMPWDTTPAVTIPTRTEGTPKCYCTPAKQWDCWECQVTRDKSADPWRWMTEKDQADYQYWTTYTGNVCTHCFDSVQMPGIHGAKLDIRASKVRTHTLDTTPDLGIYASEAWRPSCPAIFIPWTDYGLPEVEYSKAAAAIRTAFNAALAGDVVEVGCVGSHGRTGTILACMVILADRNLTAAQAIAWARQHHCHKAVEVREQETFVQWFRCWLLGDTLPSIPPPYRYQAPANKFASVGPITVNDNTVKVTVDPGATTGMTVVGTPPTVKWDPETSKSTNTANSRRREATRRSRKLKKQAHRDARNQQIGVRR
jgi:hypothetical protein